MPTQRTLCRPMQLLIACCRWPADGDAVRACAAGVDGPAFLVLARRHRVEGLAHRALTRAGLPALAQPLAGDARRIAADNLRLAAESGRLHARMAAAGVPSLLVKGVALGVLAYHELGLKMGWDIDLLVAPDDLAAAAATLTAAGYRAVLPADGFDLAAWHAFSKESVWRNDASGVHVELHTALADHPMLLPGIDARQPGQVVTLAPGLAVPTLPPDALFAHLCVHGAASGWRRLKWLADLAALLAQSDADGIERLYARSQALGAGRAAGQALLLCHRFFATPLTPALAARLRGDRSARLLARMAARMMTDVDGYDSPAERTWGTLPIHLAQVLLLPGWRYRWSELRRRFRPDPQVGGPALFYPARVLARRWRTARGAVSPG